MRDPPHTHTSLTHGPGTNSKLGSETESSSATVPTPLALLLYNTYVYSRPQPSSNRLSSVVCPLLACFHELLPSPTEETFARAHIISIELMFGGFGLTAGRYRRLRRAFPLDSRMHPHVYIHTLKSTPGRRGFHPRLPVRLPNAPSCYLRTRIKGVGHLPPYPNAPLCYLRSITPQVAGPLRHGQPLLRLLRPLVASAARLPTRLPNAPLCYLRTRIKGVGHLPLYPNTP